MTRPGLTAEAIQALQTAENGATEVVAALRLLRRELGLPRHPVIVDPRFGAVLRRLRMERGLSLRALGNLAHRSKSHLHQIEIGERLPLPQVAQQLDDVLEAGGELARLVREVTS